MTKAELRSQNLARQRSLSPDERRGLSEKIAESFFSGIDLAPVSYLHLFIPIEKFNEVDTRPIVARLRREFPNVVTVVPRVDFEANEIISLRYGPDTQVVQNVWNIDEPTHDEFVETELIDMVLTPGLCFDRAGHRVGYGKGFYDRFLAKCRDDCVKVGLSYFEPVERITDAHDGDVAVDRIVTPGRIFDTEI